uniref:AMP-dependent synthetase/ligase domain-containing protein n=2 Tax=Photinus pyralis TaxID=7054 RepID=A0A1Y1L6R0_PHOPY
MATAKRLPRLGISKIALRYLSDKIVRSIIKDNTVSKQSLSDYVWKNLDKWSDKTALVCVETKRSYSYLDVYKKSNKIANFLTNSKDLRKGDVVATILPNVPEYAMIVLGAIQAGLKITPLNPDYTREEITHCLKLSKPKLIFTLTDLWPNIYNVVQNVPIVLMNHRKEVMDIPAGAVKLSEVFDNTCPFKNRISDWNDVIYLPYSSGTTGLFKCIELTNGNLVSTIHHISVPEFRIQTLTDGNNQDVFPAILPMHHIFGIHTVLENLTLGCKAITIPKFNKETFIDVLENEKLTHCYLAPPLMQLLVNEPRIKPECLTRMRTIAVGAAPLGVNDVQRLHEKTKGNANILQGYGLTEAAGGICWQTPYISGGVKIGGCGMIYPTMELKIESESGL